MVDMDVVRRLAVVDCPFVILQPFPGWRSQEATKPGFSFFGVHLML